MFSSIIEKIWNGDPNQSEWYFHKMPNGLPNGIDRFGQTHHPFAIVTLLPVFEKYAKWKLISFDKTPNGKNPFEQKCQMVKSIWDKWSPVPTSNGPQKLFQMS